MWIITKRVFQALPTLLFIIHPFFPTLAGGEGNEGKMDTLRDPSLNRIFDREPLTLSYLQQLEDSLHRKENPEKFDRLPFSYLEKPIPSEKRIVRMIDSLLDGGKVDRDAMRGIRILIARKRARQQAPFLIPYGNDPHPASKLLENWDTRRIAPYDRRMRTRKKMLRLIAPEWECGFQVPVEGRITSSYGIRDGKQHVGVDLDLQTRDPVRAAFPGEVRVSRYFDGYGRMVLIRHPNGLETLYAHLYRSSVEPGDRVEAGERIGSGGSTGHSTGSHLHFEVRYRGNPLNPAHFISFEEKELMGDTLILKDRRNGIAVYPAGTEFHEVELGDHLYKIAKRYGTSIEQICELNNIHRNKFLQVGERLRVSR